MFHAYIRRSTAKQAISPERQLEDIKSSSKCDLSQMRVWEEQPISGKAALSARPVLKDLLSTLKEGDTLFVASPSRLARSQMVYQTIVSIIHTKKVKVVFADGTELDLNDPISVLLGNIMSFVSEYERQAISHRTKTALSVIKDKKALGRPDLVKYGWRADQDGMLIPHEGEQAVLQMIQTWSSHGVTQTAIASRLNEGGYRNRLGRKWNQPRVSQMLSNMRRLVSP